MRARLRVTVLPAVQSGKLLGRLDRLVGETRSIGWRSGCAATSTRRSARLSARRSECWRRSTRCQTDVGYAYLSAAGDCGVSQVVDDVRGVHCLIRKCDFVLTGSAGAVRVRYGPGRRAPLLPDF